MPRRPTSADVALEAGVSRTTVSFVLNGRTDIKIPDDTRRRVLAAAERLDYHPHGPASQLARGRSQVIALVMRQTPEQLAGDAVLAETLRGLASAARSGASRVLVETLDPEDPGASYVSLLRSQHVDGVIVSGPRTDDPSLRALLRDGLPVVIQGHMPGADVPSVDVDNVAGAHRAVSHLLALGHRRIACITNAPPAYTAAQERLEGYRRAMAEAGVPVSDQMVAYGAFDAPSGHAAMAGLIARGLPFDAAFVASDVVALGAIGALREAGRQVPSDVSIVGFDDIPLAGYFYPPLTTVRLPAYELGRAAGEALLERIAGPASSARKLLPTELIVRASTAPPPGP